MTNELLEIKKVLCKICDRLTRLEKDISDIKVTNDELYHALVLDIFESDDTFQSSVDLEAAYIEVEEIENIQPANHSDITEFYRNDNTA